MSALLPVHRRPWSMIPVYALVAGLSILYMLGVAEARSLTDEASSPTVAEWWAVLLLASSTTALVGVVLPSAHILLAKIIEAAGAGVLAGQMTVYAIALHVSTVLDRPPWVTIMLGSAVALACGARAVAAVVERGQILQLTSALHYQRQRSGEH